MSSVLGEDEAEKNLTFNTDDINIYSATHQFELARALNVLHVKASTFHSYYTTGKFDKAKALLDKALKERMDMFWTTQYQIKKEETIVGLPTLKDVDIQTIHEAFQFLNKTYIEKRTKLLSLDQMQKNQLKIKQGREADIGKNDNTEKLASRRNLDKEMTIPNSEHGNDKPPPPISPTSKISQQLCGVTFDNDEDPFSSNLICDGTAGVDPELLNMTTPEFMPPAPPEPGVHFETKGGESKLKRNKSSRKSRRNKKKTSSESDAESRRPYTGNNTASNPYTLVRKGSDKIKAAKNFRTSKKQSTSEDPTKSAKTEEWTLDASPLIGQL